MRGMPTANHSGRHCSADPAGRESLSPSRRAGVDGGRGHDRLVSWASGRLLERRHVKFVVLQQEHERPDVGELQQRFSSRKSGSRARAIDAWFGFRGFVVCLVGAEASPAVDARAGLTPTNQRDSTGSMIWFIQLHSEMKSS